MLFSRKTNAHNNMKLKKAIIPEQFANRVSCAVKGEFSKPFDRADRSIFIKNLKGLNLDEFSIGAIESFYIESKAVFEMNGFISASFKVHRGVRQGCPLSAFFPLIFIYFVESKEENEGFRLISPELVSYADDINCLIKIRCIDGFFF